MVITNLFPANWLVQHVLGCRAADRVFAAAKNFLPLEEFCMSCSYCVPDVEHTGPQGRATHVLGLFFFQFSLPCRDGLASWRPFFCVRRLGVKECAMVAFFGVCGLPRQFFFLFAKIPCKGDAWKERGSRDVRRWLAVARSARARRHYGEG
jgi:hypothetical protein